MQVKGIGAYWKGWKKRQVREISSPASMGAAWRSWPPNPCVVVTPINRHTPLRTKYSCLHSSAQLGQDVLGPCAGPEVAITSAGHAQRRPKHDVLGGGTVPLLCGMVFQKLGRQEYCSCYSCPQEPHANDRGGCERLGRQLHVQCANSES